MTSAPSLHPSPLPPHRGVIIFTLGLLSLFVGLIGPIIGIMAWRMGTHDLAEIEAGRMDAAGRHYTATGRLLGIIGTFVSGVLTLFSIVWMIFFFKVMAPAFLTHPH